MNMQSKMKIFRDWLDVELAKAERSGNTELFAALTRTVRAFDACRDNKPVCIRCESKPIMEIYGVDANGELLKRPWICPVC